MPTSNIEYTSLKLPKEASSFLGDKTLAECNAEDWKKLRAAASFFINGTEKKAPEDIRVIYECICQQLKIEYPYADFCKHYSYQRLVKNYNSMEAFVSDLNLPIGAMARNLFWNRCIRLLISNLQQNSKPLSLHYIIACTSSIPSLLHKAYPGIGEFPEVSKALHSR